MKSNLPILAAFRYELRQFLHFSEEAAAKAGLHTQQYQLLLQTAAAEDPPTIGYLAERLRLRHNTVVELVNRCESAGLLRRAQGEDKRQVLVSLTAKGKRLLDKLAAAHARQLNVLAPDLIRSLKRLQKASK